MIYCFDGFELDVDKVELRQDSKAVPLEPQVFALLALLVENRDRMVAKNEIIEKIWDGRFIAESTMASRIKSARQALGDDGARQRAIKTVHGLGFRFLPDVCTVAKPAAVPIRPQVYQPTKSPPALASLDANRPSIAILPFRLFGDSESHAAIADAVPHDLIAALSRLHWLTVISRGSTFRLRDENPDVVDIGSALNVQYCLTGMVGVAANHMSVSVNLLDTRQGTVIWGDRLEGRIDTVHELQQQIIRHVVAALEINIPRHAANIARVQGPESLDVWSVFHLGLQHMFRFSRADNTLAADCFSRAIELEPGFARAHAGLSFTHFQNAYLQYERDPANSILAARSSAERGLELDPLDPFVNLTLGRSFWLEGRLEESLGWLERSTLFNPNYSFGYYARAWAETIMGNGENGRNHVDLAMQLSPLDPFLYAMKGTRALSFIAEGRPGEAARWIDEAANSPGAHAVVAMVAAIAHTLDGDDAGGQDWAKKASDRNPQLSQALFFRSIPFVDTGLRQTLASALKRRGIY